MLLDHVRARVQQRAVREERLGAVLHFNNHVPLVVSHAQVHKELAPGPQRAAQHSAIHELQGGHGGSVRRLARQRRSPRGKEAC